MRLTGWVFLHSRDARRRAFIFCVPKKTNQKRAPNIACSPKFTLICGVVENSLRSDNRPLHPQINLDFGGDMTGIGDIVREFTKEDNCSE